MTLTHKIKQCGVLCGDIAILYIALFITLFIRYREISSDIINAHLVPFTILFIPLLFLLYANGLYDLRALRNTISFWRTGFGTISGGLIIAILAFYFIPASGITPKTNLFLFGIILFISFYLWRTFVHHFLARKQKAQRVLFVGVSPALKTIKEALIENPQLGYTIMSDIKNTSLDVHSGIIGEEKPDIVIISAQAKQSPMTLALIRNAMQSEYDVTDLATFSETVLGKIPLSEINELWILEHLRKGHATYESFIRPIEFLIALILSLILLPITLLIAVGVRLSSRGPILYQQTRIGRNRKPFIMYKFRTMKNNAETEGPQWAQTRDPRATPFGRFLRATHLDEIPQLWNIMKGDIAFVGPRPERPEFVQTLEQEIPLYNIRHSTKPGLTGWAQINYHYGATVDEAREKLEYDLCYLKNRSFALDIVIFLKTLRSFFTQSHH